MPGPLAFSSISIISGETKDQHYICDRIYDKIKEYGEDKITLVLTDSPNVNKAARNLLKEKFPAIIFGPCATHVLDLFVEDFEKIPFFSILFKKCTSIVQFVNNHDFVLGLFKSHSELMLLKPGETRFATNFIMTDRVVAVKEPLEDLLGNRILKQWIGGNGKKHASTYAEVKKNIDSTKFWDDLEYLNNILEPLIEVLRLTDGKRTCAIMGELYYLLFQLQEKFSSTLRPSHKQDVMSFFSNAWSELHIPLHSAGFVLNPKFQLYEQTSNEDVMGDFLNMCTVWGFQEMDILRQLARYRRREGLFGRQSAIDGATKLDPCTWWDSFGAATPELQIMAKKILSLVCSAFACETNWSSWEYIVDKRRNRLATDKAIKLVGINANLRLIQNMEKCDFNDDYDSSE